MKSGTTTAKSCLASNSNSALNSLLKRQKQFPLRERKAVFPRGTPSTRPWHRRGATNYNRNAQFTGQSLGDNESLSLKQLCEKVVLLLALTSAERGSELAAHDLRFRKHHRELSLTSLNKICSCWENYSWLLSDLTNQPGKQL